MTKPRYRSPEKQWDQDKRLIDAALNGNTKKVQVLLANGADVHASDDEAMIRSAENGHMETVRVLLAAGADVHAGGDWSLRLAAERGKTEMVRTLLAAGADVHAREDWALRWAAWCGRTETAQALLAAGADVRARDDEALVWATFNGHTETVQVLAKHIFAPDSWRGRSRAEIEAEAKALYNKRLSSKVTINDSNIRPEHLHEAASILIDSALTCWEQVRPAPPKIHISPLPAQPRPL